MIEDGDGREEGHEHDHGDGHEDDHVDGDGDGHGDGNDRHEADSHGDGLHTRIEVVGAHTLPPPTRGWHHDLFVLDIHDHEKDRVA